MPKLDLLQLAILAIAAYRFSRLVVIDHIFEPLREKIWKKWPPSTMFGYFFTCIWCTSVWVSSLITISYTIEPAITTVICLPFAFSAIAGIVSERLER
jgi:hypothetical protein